MILTSSPAICAAGLVMTVAMGCRRAERVGEAGSGALVPAPTETRLEGVAGPMGSEPGLMVALRLPTGEHVRVNGPLAAEVGRLTGASLVLVGVVQTTTPWRTIVPSAYEVMAIDGQKPHVGVLRVEPDAVWLETNPPVRLEGTPEGLRAQNGAKIYVLGSLSEGVLVLQSFGVIRPAP